MKKILALCTIVLLFLSVTVQGQPKITDPEKHANKLTMQMIKSLNLTDQQKHDVSAINLGYIQNLIKILDDSSELNDPTEGEDEEIDTKHLSLMKLIAERIDHLKKILTPAQFDVYMDKKTNG